MSDLIGFLEAFTVAEIEKSRLKLPVTAELMDISAVPFFKLVALEKGELGIYTFKRDALPGTLWKQGPHSVRFTSEGKRGYLRDFHFPESDGKFPLL